MSEHKVVGATMSDAPDFFQWVEGSIRRRFAEGDKAEECAKLFIYDTDKSCHIMDVSGMPKHLWQLFIGRLLKLDEVSAVGFVSEAWVASLPEGNPYDGIDSLKDYPGRTEAVVMTLFVRGRQSIMKFLPITGEGEARSLGALEDAPTQQSGGRLSDAGVGNEIPPAGSGTVQ